MDKKLLPIFKAFKGKLVGTKRMQKYVCEVVALMPKNVISYITETCWFLGSMDDAWAFTFTGNDIRNQHLIFLSDELLAQHASQIRYTIAHEIGHVMLKHRNSVFVKQPQGEIKKQEKEADKFAKMYIAKK